MHNGGDHEVVLAPAPGPAPALAPGTDIPNHS